MGDDWASGGAIFRWAGLHSTLRSTAHSLVEWRYTLELRPFPQIRHRANVPATSWWALSVHSQVAARAFCRVAPEPGMKNRVLILKADHVLLKRKD